MQKICVACTSSLCFARNDDFDDCLRSDAVRAVPRRPEGIAATVFQVATAV